MNSVRQTVPPSRSSQLWEKVVSDYQRACLLHRQVRRCESRRIMEQDLPLSIYAWAEQAPGDGAEKVRQLDAMFERERARVEDAWAANELIRQQLAADLVPALAQEIAQEVRRAVALQPSPAPLAESRIPTPAQLAPPAPMSRVQPRTGATDIPGIIDFLLAQEAAQTRPARAA